MKNISLLCVVLLLNLNPVLYAQNFAGKKEAIPISAPEKTLDTKEVLQYSVEWLGIPVGKIILKTEGIEDIQGHPCYHITAVAVPNRFLKRFYDIEYKVHTYIDTQFFFPRRFEKYRRINNELNEVAVDFDQERNKAVFLRKGSNLTFKISPLRDTMKARIPITDRIPYGTQDLLSSFYYFRHIDIKENQSYPINIYYDQRNWSMDMKVGEPFRREIRKKGTFYELKVSPDAELNNYILGRRKFSVYLTTDSRRIPLEFKLDTALGPISARIQNLP
jgi:hypothetical protein